MKFWRGNRYFLKYGKREFLLGSYHKVAHMEYLSIKGSAPNFEDFSVSSSPAFAKQNIEKNFSNVAGKAIWKPSRFHELYWCGDFAMAFVGEYVDIGNAKMRYEANIYSCNKRLIEPKSREFKTMEEAKSFVERYIG